VWTVEGCSRIDDFLVEDYGLKDVDDETIAQVLGLRDVNTYAGGGSQGMVEKF
jgi:hypothetical protein